MDVSEALLWVGVALVVGLLGFFAFTSNIELNTGHGEQTGYIAEIEETGLFWKPMNVKLLSIVPTMSAKDTAYHFGMEKNLRELALNYSKSNTPVVVSYETRFFTWKWDYYCSDVIVAITPATSNNTI